MTTSPRSVGGPSVPQELRLVTEIPGPKSRELFERRNAVVARGVSTTLPVFITHAGGGVVVDVDGNSAHRLRLGHRGDHRRQRAPRPWSTAAGEQVAAVHPHLLHGHAVRGLRRGLRGSSTS